MGNSLFDLVTKHARTVATAQADFHKARLASKDSKKFINSSEVDDARKTNQIARRGAHGKSQAASLKRNAHTSIQDFFKQVAILQAELRAQIDRATINREVIKKAESLHGKVGTKKYGAEVEGLNKKVTSHKDDLRRLSNLDKQKDYIIKNSPNSLDRLYALSKIEEQKSAIFGTSEKKRQALAEAVAADRVLKAVGETPGAAKPKDVKKVLRNLSDDAEIDSQKVIVRLEAIGIRIRDLNRKALQDPEKHLTERPAMQSAEFKEYLRENGASVIAGALTFEGYQKVVADYNAKYTFDPSRKIVATKEEFDSIKAHRAGAMKVSVADLELQCGFTIPRKPGEESQPIRSALRDTKFLDFLDRREQEASARGGRAGFNLPALRAEVRKWNEANPEYQVRLDQASIQDFGKFARTNEDEIRYAKTQDSNHEESVEFILDRSMRMRCRSEINAEYKDIDAQVARLANLEKLDADMTVDKLERAKLDADPVNRGYVSWIFENAARPFVAIGDATGLNKAAFGRRFGYGEIDKAMEKAYAMRRSAAEAYEKGDINALVQATQKKDEISSAVHETIAASHGAHGVVGNTVKVVGISGLALASGGTSLTFTGAALTATVTGMVMNTALTAVDDATDNRDGMNANYQAALGEGGLIGFTSFASAGATNAVVNKVSGFLAKGGGAAPTVVSAGTRVLPASTTSSATTTATSGTAIVPVTSIIPAQTGGTLAASGSQNVAINPYVSSLLVRPASDAAVSYGFQYSQTLAETGDFGAAHKSASMAATYAFIMHSPKVIPIAGRGSLRGYNFLKDWNANRVASRLDDMVNSSASEVIPQPTALPPRSTQPKATTEEPVSTDAGAASPADPKTATAAEPQPKVNTVQLHGDAALLGGGKHGVAAASRLLDSGSAGQKAIVEELIRTRKNPFSLESRMVWRNTLDALKGSTELTPELALFLRNHKNSLTGRASIGVKREIASVVNNATVKVDLTTDPKVLTRLLKTKEFSEGVAKQLVKEGDKGIALVLDVASRNRRLGFRIPLENRLPHLKALSTVEFEALPPKLREQFIRCTVKAGKEALERGNRKIRGEVAQVLSDIASRGTPETQARIIRGASKLLGDKKHGREFATLLGEKCHDGAVSEFTRLLRRGRDKRVRMNAAYGLGVLAENGQPIPVKSVQELVKHTAFVRERGRGIRKESSEALGKIKEIAWNGDVSSKEFKTLLSWMGDKRLSAAAVQTLLKGDPDLVIPKVVKGLTAPIMSPSKRIAYLSYFEGLVSRYGPDVIPDHLASKIDALRVGFNPLRNGEVRSSAGKVYAQPGKVIQAGEVPLIAKQGVKIDDPRAKDFVVSNVVTHATRDIIVVRTADGRLQPFYRSTGKNSGKPGEWLPFDGLLEKPAANLRVGWFNKTRFCSGDAADTSHPLHRFGTEENLKISQRLSEMNLPSGRLIEMEWGTKVDRIKLLNKFLEAHGFTPTRDYINHQA